MKHIYFAFIFLLISGSISSQKKVLEVFGSFSPSDIYLRTSYAITNHDNNDLLLLFEENDLLKLYLFDKNYNQKSTQFTKTLPSKFNAILGYTIHENVYSIIYSNQTKTKFGVITANFETNKVVNKILDFKIKGERFMESIQHKNNFYLLTLTKNGSDLHTYSFDQNLNEKKVTYSLKNLEYPNPNFPGHNYSVYGIFNKNRTNNISKIESRNPNAIETTSQIIKVYTQEDQIIVSFDHNNKETNLFYIDLVTSKLKQKVFYIPKDFSKSNSYIFDNKLFQIASSSKKMKFTILDLNTEKILKEYSITNKDSINFKNSPIIMEGLSVFPLITGRRIRETEKTSKYLRKISNVDLGISVYKIDTRYNIVLGGTKVNRSSAVMSLGSGAMPPNSFGNFGAMTISFNPTFYGYNEYTSTKSTYINCLFDEDFEHLDGDIADNRYDLISDFEEKLEKPIANNIFIHNNVIHYGYFDSKDQKFRLYSFKE